MQWYFATSKAPGCNIYIYQKLGPVLVCSTYQNHRPVHMLIATNHIPYLHISCYFTCIICPLCIRILFNFQTMQYERVLLTPWQGFFLYAPYVIPLRLVKYLSDIYDKCTYKCRSLDNADRELALWKGVSLVCVCVFEKLAMGFVLDLQKRRIFLRR